MSVPHSDLYGLMPHQFLDSSRMAAPAKTTRLAKVCRKSCQWKLKIPDWGDAID
jgi:hypothetical protein